MILQLKRIIFILIFSFIFVISGFAQQKVDPALLNLNGKTDYSNSTIKVVKDGNSLRSDLGESVEVLIKARTDPRRQIEAIGGTIGSKHGDIYTALLPINSVQNVSRDDNIVYIEASRYLYNDLSSSVPKTGADVFHNQKEEALKLTGKDVIIGFTDSGINTDHPTFKDENGNTRILYVWDQYDNDGTPPLSFSYGSEYSASDIDGNIWGMYDNGQHGTHVAGTAAGNGFPLQENVGMAPEAKIIMVSNIGDDLFSRGLTSVGTLDGYDYIRTKAQSLGKRFVINTSQGTCMGPHDGTTLFEQALNNDVAQGAIICVSAGNNASDARHASTNLSSLTSDEIEFQIAGNQNYSIPLDIWYESGESVDIQFKASSDVDYKSVVSPNSSTTNFDFDKVIVTVTSITNSSLNGDNEIFVTVLLKETIYSNDPYLIKIKLSPSSGSNASRVDLWWERNYAVAFRDHIDQNITLGMPACATDAITVASYNNHTLNDISAIDDISYFSSKGPRRDGFQKPDIAGLGGAIYSSLPGGGYGYMSGTSMSSPHVTGAVALLLEDDPTLTPAQVKQKLTSSSISDNFTGTVPNSVWGSGKMNVFNAVSPSGTFPNPVSNLSATQVGSSIQLNWQNPTQNLDGSPLTNINQIRIYRDGQLLGSYSANTTSQQDQSASLGYHSYYGIVQTIDSRYSAKSSNASVTLFEKSANVLIVDDDGGSNFETYFTEALTQNSISYDIWDNAVSGTISSATMQQYVGSDQSVIWFTGNQVIENNEISVLTSFLDAGGRLFISGQDIGWYLDYQGNTTFAPTYFGAEYVQDHVNIYGIKGIESGIYSGIETTISGGSGANNQQYIDEINPINGSVPVIIYDPNSLTNQLVTGYESELDKPFSSGTRGISGSGTAAVSYFNANNGSKVVYLAFGFEAISDQNTRAEVLSKGLDWLENGSIFSLSFPTGGEFLKIGSDVEIKWAASNDISNIKIEYTTNYGGSTIWHTIASSVDASLRSYTWTVPNVTSSICKVRITDTSNPEIIDESSSTFSIRQNGPVFETEPNNSADLANAIVYSDTVFASISSESDVDYYKFTAVAGDTIEVYGEERNNSQLDGRMYLLRSNGNRIYDNSNFLSSYNQRIQWIVDQSDTYYIRYSNRNNYANFPNSVDKKVIKKLDNGLILENNIELEDNATETRANAGDYLLTLKLGIAAKPIIQSAYMQDLNYNNGRFFVVFYPNGLPLDIKIDYGTTTSYGSSLIANNITVGSSSYAYGFVFNSVPLEHNTTYYYRVTATNSKGSDVVDNHFFTTPEEPEGWSHQESGADTYSFQDVDFVDENVGWAVGDYVVYKTIDGGVNWIEQNIGYSTTFFGVEFVDANTGWIVGRSSSGGAICKTTDGGSTWTAQSSGLSNWQYFYNLKFVDSNTGWIIGRGDNGGIILKTTNGGATWTTQSSGLSGWQYFWGIDFIDTNTAWIVGEMGALLKTTDGGSSWIPLTNVTGQHLRSISFADPLNGIAVGYNRSVVRTSDGGNNWSEQNLSFGAYAFLDVKHVSSTKAILCGEDGLIAATNDGGATWTKEKSGTTNSLYSISAIDESTITVVGDYGTILSRSNGLYLTFPNSAITLKQGSSCNITWSAVGVSNIKIEYTTNYGTRATWQTIAASVDANSGSFNWTVPNIISSNCKIRITDTSDPTKTDESNYSFSIKEHGAIFETEPNNSADLANAIVYSDTVFASISAESDVDYYKFTAEAGDTIEVFGEYRNGSNLEGEIYLYNSNGNKLTNNSSFTNSINQRVVYVIPQSEEYYIRYAYRSNDGNFPNRSTEEKEEYDSFRIEKLELTADTSGVRAVTGDYLLTLDRFETSEPVISEVYHQDVNYNSVRFDGTIYPNGLETSVVFEYGTTTSYGSTITYPGTFNSLNSYYLPTTESVSLEANTTYHYRMKASNAKGIVYSVDNVFITLQAPENWILHPKINSDPLIAVDFASENDVWAVGPSTIIYSSDVGNSWESQGVSNSYLVDVFFESTNTGWACGENTLLYTNDRGVSWISQGLPLQFWVDDIYFINQNTGWIVGSEGKILKTADGGVNWLEKQSGVSDWLYGVHFINENVGWVCGGSGIILKTTDGGENWTKLNTGYSDTFYNLFFFNSSIGWLCDDAGRILKTADGGDSWELQYFGSQYSICGIEFIDSQEGWAVGSLGIILHTTDSGENWILESSGTTERLYGISVLDENHIMVVGLYGTILTRVNNGTSVDWQTDITVADAGSTRSSRVVTIGQDKSATDGLDPALGESELPPISLGFEVRLKLPNSEIYSWKDFRNSSISDLEWELIFKTEDENLPITLSWDPTRLPEGSFIISDKFDGILFTYNMKEGNSCVIPNNISALKIIRSTEVCSDITLLTGWNMVSVPVLAEDMSGNSLFPNKEGSIYKYENGYQVVDTIKTGVGYWEKNSKAESVNVCGVPVSGDITVKAGWNMIGINDISVPVGNITSIPANITTTPYYGYNTSGYYVEDTLKVGEGYWIKCSQDGVLQLNSTTVLAKTGSSKQSLAKVSEDWGKVTITDARERSKVMYLAPSGTDGELYSVPPAPPEGIFDVRFSGDSYVKEEDNIEEDLLLTSVVYPVRITVEGIDVRIADKLDGSIVDKVLVDGSSYVISNESVERLLIEMTEIPISYELKQNYPNPFNPSTTIQFGLPEASKVKLHIFNVLGQRVATLIDKQMDIGYHKVSFDASQLASGVYIYRIETPNFVNSKKMLLMK